jgi:hypothetical protein
MSPRLNAMLPDNVVLNYVGREDASSPATGSIKVHQAEEREIVAAALELPSQSPAAHEATKPGTPATAKSPTAVSG